MKKRKKQFITLIEIMIVIFLIGLIGGALAFNMRGSMDEGRAFKTRQNIERIRDILQLELAKGNATGPELQGAWKAYVHASSLVDGKKTDKDGWGNEFKVEFNMNTDDFDIKSDSLIAFENRHDPKKQK